MHGNHYPNLTFRNNLYIVLNGVDLSGVKGAKNVAIKVELKNDDAGLDVPGEEVRRRMCCLRNAVGGGQNGTLAGDWSVRFTFQPYDVVPPPLLSPSSLPR